jgi:soluble lytic murein transglycosylase-like protein
MAVLWSIKPITAAQKEAIIGMASGIAREYDVPRDIVLGVIEQESKYDPQSYRWNEEKPADRSFGLMHLTIPTAQEMADKIYGLGKVVVNDQYLYVPENNLRLGIYYLREQYEKYGQDWPNAISAYNAGRPISGNIVSYVQEVIAKGGALSSTADKVALTSLFVGSILAIILFKKFGSK